MLKIFISSHGHFARGMKSSIEILTGPKQNVTVFDAYIDQETVQEHLDAFYETVTAEDQVLLISDLYGGSVNSVMYTYLTKPNTTLIAGANLALVLELAIREEIDPADLSELVEQSRSMMRIVEFDAGDQDTTEQDDFF